MYIDNSQVIFTRTIMIVTILIATIYKEYMIWVCSQSEGEPIILTYGRFMWNETGRWWLSMSTLSQISKTIGKPMVSNGTWSIHDMVTPWRFHIHIDLLEGEPKNHKPSSWSYCPMRQTWGLVSLQYSSSLVSFSTCFWRFAKFCPCQYMFGILVHPSFRLFQWRKQYLRLGISQIRRHLRKAQGGIPNKINDTNREQDNIADSKWSIHPSE